MKKGVLTFAETQLHLFLLSCAAFIPFPFNIFTFQEIASNFLFKDIAVFLGKKMTGINPVYPEISSDSILLYILVLVLLCLSFLATAGLSFNSKWPQSRNAFLSLCRKVLSYYLALQLFNYGIDKVLKGQFYSPEPNILYTPFGSLEKDILFWSTMGTSHLYNLITGILEIIPAIFIFMKRTRPVGLLLASVVLLQVVIINFSFDISVKIYSVFLGVLSLFLLGPQFKQLYSFLIKREASQLKAEPDTFLFLERPAVKVVVKTFVICLFVLEAFYPYPNKTAEPFLHGAYEVISEIPGKDSLSRNEISIKRFFIHKDGYLIFQTLQDEMLDYRLTVNKATNQFILTDYQLKETTCRFRFDESGGVIELQNPFLKSDRMIRARAIEWKKLPALQDGFNWTLEGAANDQ